MVDWSGTIIFTIIRWSGPDTESTHRQPSQQSYSIPSAGPPLRPMAIRLETTRVPGQTTIPVILASQQTEVSAVTSLVTLALSPKHSNTCTTTTATINDNHNNCRALSSTNTTLTTSIRTALTVAIARIRPMSLEFF